MSEGQTERATLGTRIERLAFSRDGVGAWTDPGGKHRNWPIVYTLNNDQHVYIGESLNAAARMRQHLEADEKRDLTAARIIVDDTFNKSVCLDLESFLIRMFSGDRRFEVLNRNVGVTDADYFDRATYQRKFEAIFEELRASGLFGQSIPEIVNSDLFKLSPFKALNKDQEIVIENIVEALFDDLDRGLDGTAVVDGGPGTGKTIVGVYLMKLLVDVQTENDHDNPDAESVFSDFFLRDHAELLDDARFGFVIPQQSLRDSVRKVFAHTPGLSSEMVVSPYDVGLDESGYDVLLVDEAHRLTRYGGNGPLTGRYNAISQSLAADDEDWRQLTQLDWIMRRSRHQVFFVDTGQSVRPIDVSAASLAKLREKARREGRDHRLLSQMRVAAGDDYTGYVRAVLDDARDVSPRAFDGYDLRFFDNLATMREEIFARDAEHGLARLVAGYAWKWNSDPKRRPRPGPEVYDIGVDGLRLVWNRTATDWISSPTSLQEVGSIHTVQGYDLNYAGVIIGPDLYLDRAAGRIRFDPGSYFDARGKQRKAGDAVLTDDDLLLLVKNIYAVLLTRGIRGTYVYVCDPALREHLHPYFGHSTGM
jgi:DUF2075 family protein